MLLTSLQSPTARAASVVDAALAPGVPFIILGVSHVAIKKLRVECMFRTASHASIHPLFYKSHLLRFKHLSAST
jgi:hypothetical protein